MPIRELLTVFGLDFKGNDFKKADTATNKLASAAKKLVGALSAALIVRSIRNIVTEIQRLGDTVDKTSQRIGVSSDALQELRFAGGLTGATTGEVDKALEQLARRTAEAASGNEEYAESFRDLGVEVVDANGEVRAAADVFGDIAEGMQRTTSQSERVRLAFDFFGRSGVKLTNLLKLGGNAIAGMRAEARALGGVLDKDLIRLTAEATDEELRLDTAVLGLKASLARQFLPSVIRIRRGLSRWVAENRALIATGIKTFLESLAKIARSVASTVERGARAFVELQSRLIPLNSVLGATVAIVGILTALFGLKAIVIAAVIGAIFLLVDELEVLRKGGKTAIGSLLDELDELFEKLKEPIDEDDSPLLRLLKRMEPAITAARDALVELGKFIDERIPGLGAKLKQALFEPFGLFAAQLDIIDSLIESLSAGIVKLGETLSPPSVEDVAARQARARAGNQAFAQSISQVLTAAPNVAVSVTGAEGETAAIISGIEAAVRQGLDEAAREILDFLAPAPTPPQ